MISPDPRLDLYAVILLMGILPGLLLSVLLFRQSHKTAANTWLGLLTLLLTLSLLEIFLNHTTLIVYVMVLYNFSEPLQFLLGPAFYLHQRAANKTFPRRTYIWHLVPFVLFFAYWTIELSAPTSQKYNNYIAGYLPTAPFLPVAHPKDLDPLSIRAFATTWGIALQLSIYVALTSWEFRKRFLTKALHKKKIWVRNFIVICAIGAMIFFLSKWIFGSAQGENIVGVYLTFLLFAIGYFALRESPFFQSEATKYGTSSLSPEKADIKLRELQQLMETDKPFLQSDVSMEALAQRLSISEHHLSQIINERLQTNFFGMINTYRTQEAKEYLTNTSFGHLKIEEIGYKVGYNSKSAFYTAFKKEYNQTPQTFRQQARKS